MGIRFEGKVNTATFTLMKIGTVPDDQVLRELAASMAGPIFCRRGAIPLLRESKGWQGVRTVGTGVLAPGGQCGFFLRTRQVEKYKPSPFINILARN